MFANAGRHLQENDCLKGVSRLSLPTIGPLRQVHSEEGNCEPGPIPCGHEQFEFAGEYPFWPVHPRWATLGDRANLFTSDRITSLSQSVSIQEDR